MLHKNVTDTNTIETQPVQFRSPLAREIVSNKPGLLIRYGTAVLFVLLIALCIISWYIKYPEIIKTHAKLTSINVPKEVIAVTDGKLIKLNVTESEMVHKGDILGVIESTGNHADILQLSVTLDTLDMLLNDNKAEFIYKYFETPNARLGELQVSYQTFYQSFLTFKNYLSNGFYISRKKMLLKDQTNLQKMNNSLLQQKKLQEEDLALTQQTFDANKILNDQNQISDFEYRKEQSKLISKKLALPQIDAAVINNQNQQNEKQKEILELENSILQQKMIFQQSLNSFKSIVQQWRKKYLITAPIDGQIAFAIFLQENQQLHANQTICFVNPGNSRYFAQITIPQSNFGKVSVGQQVLLKFPSYPYQEFGIIKGRITFISVIPTDSGYSAKVDLVNDLNSTYNRKIQFREGLAADAELITKDIRLLQRLYYNLLPK